MSCAKRVLAVLAVSMLGIWGCAPGAAGGANSAERIKALEAKNLKLEDDFRAAASTRDQLRKRVATVEEQRAKLQQEIEQLQLVVKERDDLLQMVKARTTERDQMQGQFEQFRKGIRELLGQTEAAMNLNPPAAQPVTSTVAAGTPAKS